MPPSLSSHTTFSLLTFTFFSLFCIFFCPSVLAQKFTPLPAFGTCNVFVEGQGLYLFGGSTEVGDSAQDITQAFMLDLSVSWNTSDPVYRRLENGPKVLNGPCAVTNDGENVFLLSGSKSHIYSIQSNSWTVLDIKDLAVYRGKLAVMDPETGLIYLPDTTALIYSLDLRTNTVNTTKSIAILERDLIVWSAYLRSMVKVAFQGDHYTFTPSNVSESSTGWNLFRTGTVPERHTWACALPAFGGSKILYIVEPSDVWSTIVYTLDVATRTWTKGPGTIYFSADACAVSGDQVILWGAFQLQSQRKTVVYDLKTGKWTDRYIAPPPRPATNTTGPTHASQPPQTPTQHIPSTTPSSDMTSSDKSSSDTKPGVIIAIVAGTLLSIAMICINIYLRISKRSKVDSKQITPDGSSFESLDNQGNTGSSGKEGNSNSGPNPTATDHNTRRRWYMTGPFNRLHRGALGARPVSEHPHAIVEDPTEKRNAQEGALEVQFSPQQPHAMVGEGFAPKHNDKAEYIEEDNGGKEERES